MFQEATRLKLGTLKKIILTGMKVNMKDLMSKESPIMLEKLLTGKHYSNELREPNLLASPNAFDWEKRLAMPGGSPNAFALSLSGNGVPDNQLFEYPELPQLSPPAITQHSDLSTFLLMDQMVAVSQEQNNSPFTLVSDGEMDQYSEESSSSMSGGLENLLNPLPLRRSTHDRKDSHRESERRRRESFKNAMCHLENLVLLTLNRAGSGKIVGKGPNRKLAHSEVYKMARDIIVTLKEEIAKVDQMNHEMTHQLQNN